MHLQQCEKAGEAQRRPVHAQQPHGMSVFIINDQVIPRKVRVHTATRCACISRRDVVKLGMFCFGQSEHFSFLGVNNQSNLSDMRCRTTFYTALGRLLMVDLGMFLPVSSLGERNNP